MASGTEPQGNSLLPAVSLSEDGILSTTRIFDFEKESAYDIHVRARDSEGLFVNGVLKVRVADEFRPIVRTLESSLKREDLSIFAVSIGLSEPEKFQEDTVIPVGTEVGFLSLGLPESFQLESYNFTVEAGDLEDFILDGNGSLFAKRDLNYLEWAGSVFNCRLFLNDSHEFEFSVFINPSNDPDLNENEFWSISVDEIVDDSSVRMSGVLLDEGTAEGIWEQGFVCLLYTSPSPRDRTRSRMPSSA